MLGVTTDWHLTQCFILMISAMIDVCRQKCLSSNINMHIWMMLIILWDTDIAQWNHPKLVFTSLVSPSLCFSMSNNHDSCFDHQHHKKRNLWEMAKVDPGWPVGRVSLGCCVAQQWLCTFLTLPLHAAKGLGHRRSCGAALDFPPCEWKWVEFLLMTLTSNACVTCVDWHNVPFYTCRGTLSWMHGRNIGPGGLNGSISWQAACGWNACPKCCHRASLTGMEGVAHDADHESRPSTWDADFSTWQPKVSRHHGLIMAKATIWSRIELLLDYVPSSHVFLSLWGYFACWQSMDKVPVSKMFTRGARQSS